MFTQSTSGGSHTSFTKDTLMNITINPYYIKEETLTYHFAYVPTYVGTTGNIYYYDQSNKDTVSSLDDITIDLNTYPYVSKLVVPGIVRYQSSNSISGTVEVFADKEFYAMAYNLLNDDEYEEGKFILYSKLGNQISSIDLSQSEILSFSDTTAENYEDRDTYIDSLKGIDLMTGINVLSFEGTDLVNGSELFIIELGYISKITQLRILNLSSTNIYDQTGSNIGFPEGENNNILETLSALTNLEELYLANNKIYSFDALESFASLKKVDITNNSFESNISNSSYLDFLDDMLTDLVNSLYGTFGANNIGVIANLETNGVEVVKGTNTNGELKEEMKDIVKALSSLEHQDRLDKDADISNIFALYPTYTETDIDNSVEPTSVCNFYGISESFVMNNSGTNVVFEFVTAIFVETENGFEFQITYNWESSGWFSQNGTIVFDYEYKVSRY